MIFSNKTYDRLKWMCLIALPAVSVLYAAIDKTFGIGHASDVCAIISAVTAFIGSCIGISTASYNAKVGEAE